ncbi:MAG TPA: glycosyl transferase [Candidatus Sericytochromatia bacterium]
MYRSLLRHGGDFHLWIICFDDLASELLDKLNLEKVTLSTLSQFEDEELLRIKPQRTRQEYCWTCTPSTALYVLNTEPHVDAITYLDADLMFFSSPEPIFTEAGNASILLTEHRYLAELDQSTISGIYNVQFMRFRRNSEGLQALNWWRDRCLEWCFARVEDNKFGDQKYLDDWPERFTGVHILQHLGGGVAPWNSGQYSFKKIEHKVYVENQIFIFYHFHALKLYPFNIGYCCEFYPITMNVRNWIYQTYFNEIGRAYQTIRSIDSKFNLGIIDFPKIPKRPDNFSRLLMIVLKEIQEGRYYRYA